MALLTVLVVLSWIAIAVLGLALGGILRQVRELQESHGGRVPDAINSDFSTISRRLHLPSGSKVVMFARDDCLTCGDLVPMFGVPSTDDLYERVVLYANDIPDYAEGIDATVRGHTQWAFDASGVRVTPTLMVIDGQDETVVVGSVGSASMLRERLLEVPYLLEGSVNDHS